jgi:hypothetical protein
MQSAVHAPKLASLPHAHNGAPMPALTRFLAIALLLGTVLLGGGAAMHPMLGGDGAMQLRMIGEMTAWRTLHLCMLAGAALVIAGIWVRLTAAPAGEPAEGATIAALAIITVGLALNALNTTFMGGPAWRMATAFAAGDSTMATRFDVMHPVGLMAARFGNFIIALGAIVLGAAEWMTKGRPRWLAALAWLAAAGGLVGAIFFDETRPEMLGAVSLLSGWQVGAALVAFFATMPRPAER